MNVHPLIRRTQRAYHEGFKFDQAAFLRQIKEHAHLKEARRALSKMMTQSKRIVIFGDYDVDGIFSSYMMYKTIRNMNSDADVHVILPERSWGYGLSTTAQNLITMHHPNVIVLIDNGIKSRAEVELIKNKIKTEVIVIDHHHYTREDLPDSELIVHPNLFPGIEQACASGIVWALCRPLLREGQDEYDQLAAIGTIADSVPLKGFNFYLARHGLLAAEQGNIESVRLLLEETTRAQVSYGAIEDEWRYHVIPCFNACGRVHDPQVSFAHLVEPTQESAKLLLRINRERKDLTHRLSLHVAESLADRRAPYPHPGVLTYYLPSANVSASATKVAGVIGLIAQRLSMWYHAPAIVLTDSPKDDGVLVGSMRVPETWQGASALEILDRASGLLTRYGGHHYAAGLGLRLCDLDEFAQCVGQVEAKSLKMRYDVEALLGMMSLIYTDSELQRQLNVLRPFGHGNPELRLCMPDAYATFISETENRLIFQVFSNDKRCQNIRVSANWWINEHCFPPSIAPIALSVLATRQVGLIFTPEFSRDPNSLYACNALRIVGVRDPGAFAALVLEETTSRLAVMNKVQ